MVDVVRDAADAERWNVGVDIAVLDMNTGHDGRDGNMRRMLRADRFDTIHGEARGVDPLQLKASAGSGAATVPIALRVAGAEHAVEASVRSVWVWSSLRLVKRTGQPWRHSVERWPPNSNENGGRLPWSPR